MNGFRFRIECAASGDAPDAKGKAFASGLAYAGGKLQLGWGFPVVVDLDGMECAGAVPLLANHVNRTSARLGLVTPKKTDGMLTVEGEIVAESDDADAIVKQAKAGAAWQLSIGAEVFAAELVEDGTRNVNGVEHAAPFYHVTKSALREVSVVAVGADAATSMEIAAAAHIVGGFAEPKKPAPDGGACDWEARYHGLQAAKDREIAAVRKSFQESEKALAQANARIEQLSSELGEGKAALAEANRLLAEEKARYQAVTGRALRPGGADDVTNWSAAVDRYGYAEACRRHPGLKPAVTANKKQ